MEEIELFSPSNLKIVGAVAADGSIRSFKYSYDRDSMVRLYVLDDGTSLPDGPVQLAASDGSRWNSTEVEWHTLFKGKL